MSIRSSIWSQLSGLSALAGYGLYPDAIPEKEVYPAVLFVFKNIRGLYDLDGVLNVHNGTVTFSVYSYDKTDCVAGMLAVKTAFDGFTGAMGDIAIRNVMKILEEGDEERAAPDGSSKVLFVLSQKYSINYQDAA